MKNRIKYRSVFISDLHLGFRGCNSKALLLFLKSIECDNLFLIGDVFDFWAIRSKIWWNSECTAVIRRILKMIKSGTKVIYLPGNHDDDLRHFLPFAFGSEIEFADEYVYTTLTGKKLLLIHGDIFDVVAKWLSILGSHVYDWLLVSNGVLHKIRMLLGYKKYWSLAGYLKKRTKKALSAVKDFENAVIHHAHKAGCSGVICGHIHTAVMYEKDGMLYINCGDWVESNTAIVENLDGKFELIHWLESIDYKLIREFE